MLNLKTTTPDNDYIQDKQVEWQRCRANPLYFIYNYVHIQETGGGRKLTKELLHPKMVRVIRSVYRYHNCVLMASRQLGKALDINTPIPIPNGEYKLMKDLVIGDYVLNEFNQPVQITNCTDIMYNRPCYALTFSDGSHIIADENHLWKLKHGLIVRSANLLIDDYVDHRRIIDIQMTSVPVRCIEVKGGMYLCGTNKIPTHNSTISACLIAWSQIFFNENRAVILNMKQTAALENLAKIRFIIQNLPEWMVTSTPFRSKSEIKSYIDLFNGSKIQVFYPSTVHDPGTLGRSLTSPILYIDEAAFIPKMREIFG